MPAEAGERLDAFYRHRRQAALPAQPKRRKSRPVPDADVPVFELPATLADAGTVGIVGIVYDEIDGLNLYNDFGMLRELFTCCEGT